LKGDALLSVHVLNKSHLMIQAKDNLIRHYELIGNRIRLHQAYSGATFDSELSNCAVSPDNKYLLSPSEAGKAVLWDVFTGTQISLDHLGLNIKGKLVCCDWHPKYNLVAISGFVNYCPLFVYGNILSEAEIKMVSAQLQ
jgi:WD40 repeat protein